MMRLFFLLSLTLSLASLLAGCTTVASSGASAIYNHKSLEKSANDELITMRSYQAIDIDSDHFRKANINVSTFNRVVLLSGQALTPEQKTEAEEIVRKIDGVAQVYNWITVEKPASQSARLNDAWLTTKIKAKLMLSSELDSDQVKVVTENRRVFLMGILRPMEANAAVRAASTTSGVDQVVKLFYYLNLSKTPLPEAEG